MGTDIRVSSQKRKAASINRTEVVVFVPHSQTLPVIPDDAHVNHGGGVPGRYQAIQAPVYPSLASAAMPAIQSAIRKSIPDRAAIAKAVTRSRVVPLERKRRKSSGKNFKVEEISSQIEMRRASIGKTSAWGSNSKLIPSTQRD